MYNKTDTKVKPTVVPLVFPLQNYKLGTKEISEWKHVQKVKKIPSLQYIYIYIHIDR